MKIIHIATLFSDDGAYGGPTTVAINQARALMALGHDVTFVAGYMGGGRTPPESVGGVPVRLFPVSRLIPRANFAGLYARGLLAYLGKNLRTTDFVHLHLSRDIIMQLATTLVRRFGVPYAVQPHGMIVPSQHPLASMVDFVFTVPNLRHARYIYALTDQEQASIGLVAGSSVNTTAIVNGTPIEKTPPRRSSAGPVIFLARLNEVKRPEMFVESARTLLGEFPLSSFILYGPDGGQGHRIESLIAEIDAGLALRWDGPVPPHKVNAKFQSAAAYVLPSSREVIPMSVLEAMSNGTPVIIGENTGISSMLRDHEAGLVFDGSQDSLTECIRTILRSPVKASELGQQGRSLVSRYFDISSIGKKLESDYQEAVKDPR